MLIRDGGFPAAEGVDGVEFGGEEGWRGGGGGGGFGAEVLGDEEGLESAGFCEGDATEVEVVEDVPRG